jgi:Uma2 family endonuclease
MVVQLKQRMTVTDFDRWIINQDSDYEYVGREALAVVSNNYASQVAMLIGSFLTLFVSRKGLGWVTGADGGYQVNDDRYIPDVGYISKTRQAKPNHDTYNPLPPDLAVEVLSPTDREKTLLIKVSNYLAAGTVVWVVYPEEKEVYIHRPGKGAELITVEGKLTTDLLPDFALSVKGIFPSEETTE